MIQQAQSELSFDGTTYVPTFDCERLTDQYKRVWDVMKDGEWITLPEIATATGDHSEAAISARIRDFRKPRFGSHEVNRRRRGDPKMGLFEYRLSVSEAG